MTVAHVRLRAGTVFEIDRLERSPAEGDSTMNRITIALAASVLSAPLFAAAQTQQPPTPQTTPQQQTQKAPDVTLTGCLVQGSAPNVFVFQDAKMDPKSATEKGAKYVVVAGTEDLMLREHLNHEIRITGQAEKKTVTAQTEEKDLPKLTAKSVTLVSNTCATAAAR
jgi:hypothetical protein